MPDLKTMAGTSTLALVTIVAPTLGTSPSVQVAVHSGTTGGVRVPKTGLTVKSVEMLTGVEGVDFGQLTEADLAMLQHAATASAEEVDFSEFYLDDE